MSRTSSRGRSGLRVGALVGVGVVLTGRPLRGTRTSPKGLWRVGPGRRRWFCLCNRCVPPTPGPHESSPMGPGAGLYVVNVGAPPCRLPSVVVVLGSRGACLQTGWVKEGWWTRGLSSRTGPSTAGPQLTWTSVLQDPQKTLSDSLWCEHTGVSQHRLYVPSPIPYHINTLDPTRLPTEHRFT